MGPSTNKKVLVSRFDRDTLAGFVNLQTYQTPSGIELLSPGGSFSLIPYPDIKLLCFVRDFQDGDPKPEIRTFSARPKMPGLWVRMRFRDGDWMDGVLPNNLLLLEPHGFTMIPPDPGYQNQRVFVPRTAVTEIQVLGVIGGGAKPSTKKISKPREQIELFGNN